jgi:hypothetical protein
LAVYEVRSPGFSDVPGHCCEPFLGAESWYCAISIAGVMEHSVFTSELLVNPLAAQSAYSVLNFKSAKFPLVDAGWDVKGLADVSTVDKVEKRVSPSA